MKTWVWRNIHLTLPNDWEMLQYDRRVDLGRMAFADRSQYRMEVNWRGGAIAPDFERMISDYVQKLGESAGAENVKKIRSGKAEGLAVKVGDVLTTRFGRHLPDAKCLVELVFIWPGERDPKLEREILDSIQDEPVLNGLQHWAAFGLDLRTGSGLELIEASILPGRAAMWFRDLKTERDERFSRWGILPVWLKKPVGEWMKSQAPAGLKEIQTDNYRLAEHEVFSLSGIKKSSGFIGAFGGKLSYSAEAWICPEDQHLYFASVMARRLQANQAPERLAARRARCCEKLG